MAESTHPPGVMVSSTFYDLRQVREDLRSFVEQGIVSLIPVWKANPTGDFSTVVDTTKLFEFIEQVRSIDKVWMREFKHASDVVDALRIQFAYQHRDGLLLQNAIRNAGDQHWVSQIHGETLRIALEKSTAWEYRLFAHALVDALKEHDRLRRRYEAGIPLSAGEDVNDATKWISARFADAQRMIHSLNTSSKSDASGSTGPARNAWGYGKDNLRGSSDGRRICRFSAMECTHGGSQYRHEV